MDCLITRGESGDQGTFGRLRVGGFECFSGELPWRDNAASVSCIPPGSYTCVWAWSPHLRKMTYRLLAVPGRSGVLIHSGNFVGDRSKGFKAQFLGCIALGEKLGAIGGQKAILVSRPAVRRFEEVMAGKPFILEILNA